MTPRLPAFPIVDQAEWGHPAPYADYARTPDYRPTMWVLHWTGYGADIRFTWQAKASALSVRRYHLSRGFSDIAYNIYDWWPPLRLRGMNANGAHLDSTYWGKRTLTCYFPTGTAYPTPHHRMLKGFCWSWALAPAPVTGHGLLPPSPSGVEQKTECPGPWLRNFIRTEGWLDTLAARRTARFSWRHRLLKYRLTMDGYWNPDLGYSRFRNRRLVQAVRAWQVNVGRPVTGVMGREDWERLCAY